MTYWPWVLVPAILTSLTINFDARFSGPYFALSSLISSTEGPSARDFISDRDLRKAFLRRFLYPTILGFILAWHITNLEDIGASGGISASLLIWPALFHPRLQGVRRQLDVIFLYASFIGSFTGLSISGALLKNLLVNLSDGKVLHWVENQLLSMLLVSAIVLIFSAFYRSTYRRIFMESEK